MAEQDVVLQDGDGHRTELAMDELDDEQFAQAVDDFLVEHVGADAPDYRLQRPGAAEALMVDAELDLVARIRGTETVQAGYRLCTSPAEGAALRLLFARGGYDALEDHGPWAPEWEDLLPEEADGPGGGVELERIESLRRQRIAALPPLDPAALETFLRTWGDTGYVQDDAYILFDDMTHEEAGARRDALLAAVRTLGLELLPAPEGAADGEVRVRTDLRVDAELEQWS